MRLAGIAVLRSMMGEKSPSSKLPSGKRREYLITGRKADRAADGSFLVTEEELRPLRQLSGFIVCDD